MHVDWILLALRVAAPLLLYLFLGIITFQIVAWHKSIKLRDVERRLAQGGQE